MGDSAAATLSRLDRARYRFQQNALLHLLAPGMGVWHRLVGPRLPAPGRGELAALRERLAALFSRDLENVERGAYPRELLFQLPLARYLRELPALLQEPPRVLWRMLRGADQDLPRDIDLEAFPRYYRRTFHWQTDGWLSLRSAALYDLEVEALFGGTADVMRRMALPALAEGLRDRRAPRVLDVACGTGRFLRQLLPALPRARAWGLDLSPFYLARAQDLLREGHPVSLVAENAERMPFRSGFFDAASCLFLFHELPPPVRRRVAQEVRRVLKPGAPFALCDAAQLSESPDLRSFLEAFPRLYHEPYFKSYLRDDLARLLAECGFEVESVEPAFLAKVVVARRPRRRDRAPSSRSGREPGSPRG